MSYDQRALDQPQQHMSLWVLHLYINDSPVMLVNSGYNAKHAQKRMLGSVQRKNLNQTLFPGTKAGLALINHDAKLSVWNGYWDENEEKVFIPVDDLVDAINQAWLEKATGTLVMA